MVWIVSKKGNNKEENNYKNTWHGWYDWYHWLINYIPGSTEKALVALNTKLRVFLKPSIIAL